MLTCTKSSGKVSKSKRRSARRRALRELLGGEADDEGETVTSATFELYVSSELGEPTEVKRSGKRGRQYNFPNAKTDVKIDDDLDAKRVSIEPAGTQTAAASPCQLYLGDGLDELTPIEGAKDDKGTRYRIHNPKASGKVSIMVNRRRSQVYVTPSEQSIDE